MDQGTVKGISHNNTDKICYKYHMSSELGAEGV